MSSPFGETIGSWDARASGAMLSLAWNTKNELAAISLCGLSGESYACVNAIPIGKGDWPQSLTLFMQPIDIWSLTASSAVVGVRVLMSSGIDHNMGDTSAGHIRRYVAPPEGREIVGFQGRIDEVEQ